MATPEKMHGGVPVNENMKAQVRTDAGAAGSLVSAQLSPDTALCATRPHDQSG